MVLWLRSPPRPETQAAAAGASLSGSTSRATPSEPIRLLIVATTCRLAYHVARCAERCEAEIFILGDAGAKPLSLSRYCRRFIPSHRTIGGTLDEDLTYEINCLAGDLGVTMVLPGDAPATRALIACRHLLDVPCFPLPDLVLFDRLNDKWRFAEICADLGLRHPATRLFADRDALWAALAAGQIAHPAVLKAPSLSGGQGFVKLDDSRRHDVPRITYRPILVQKFIPGRNIVASMYCQGGEIRAFVAHEVRRRVYSTFWNDRIFDDLSRMAAHFSLGGVYNFDMIAGDDGEIYYLECNPRFFFTMPQAMLAGINFVALGLPTGPPPGLLLVPEGTKVRAPEAVLASPGAWLRLTRRDAAAMGYVLSDPMALLVDHFPWVT